MKIAPVKAIIPSQVGDLISGYGPNFGTVAKHDELEVNGFCLDDGKSRALFLSFDILGLDREVVLELRNRCSKALNCPPQAVLLSCTHTHGGPAYRSNAAQKRNMGIFKQKKSRSLRNGSLDEAITLYQLFGMA